MRVQSTSDQRQKIDRMVDAAQDLNKSWYNSLTYSIEVSPAAVYFSFTDVAWDKARHDRVREVCESHNLVYKVIPLDNKLAVKIEDK